MRDTFDMTPFTRSGIGFERLLNQLQTVNQPQPQDNYPPYNIEKTSEDNYRVVLAVAGFGQEELAILAEGNLLTVTGKRAPDTNEGMLYCGIARRPFTRRFSLAEYVTVKDASLSGGLLTIELERRVPEAMKPRHISIATGEENPNGSQRVA